MHIIDLFGTTVKHELIKEGLQCTDRKVAVRLADLHHSEGSASTALMTPKD